MPKRIASIPAASVFVVAVLALIIGFHVKEPSLRAADSGHGLERAEHVYFPPAPGGSAQTTGVIRIQSATWSASNSSNVTDRLRQQCDGRASCSGLANVASFGDPQFGVFKTLRVSYSCGSSSSHSVSVREHINWALSCPPASQPNAIADIRIHHEATCSERDGTEVLTLPQGYNYCWDRKWDMAKGGQSDSSGSLSGTTLTIKWKVRPEGFPCPTFGRGWIDHQYAIVGARDTSTCPPRP
jgi:hypothetical protein